MKMTISCIGSGNMGAALMKSAAKAAGAQTIGFCDIDRSKAEAAASGLGAKVFDSNTEAARNGDYVFLAVKPQILSKVLEEIAPVLGERLASGNAPVLVSMAAGWTIEKIKSHLDCKIPVARIMPNTPALVSKGVVAMTFSPEVTAHNAAELAKILEASGIVDTLDEKYFDAVTGLSGSGPAFVYLFIEALADGGVKAGLPRDRALKYACQTVLGSAAMVIETGKHPGELKDMVTSPGGTTIAGLHVLEKEAFRGAVMGAVEAAWKRAAELG